VPDGGVTLYPAYKPYTLFSCYSRHVFEIHHKIKHAARQKTTSCWLFFAGDKPNEKAHRIS
jgi:hypothetical protein